MKKNIFILCAMIAAAMPSGAAFAGPVRSPVEIKQASNPSERNEGLAVFADAKKEGPEIYHSGKKNGVGGGLNVAYGAAKNIGNRIKSWIGNMSRIRTVAFT